MFFLLALIGLAILFQLPPVATTGVAPLSGAILVSYWVALWFVSRWRRDQQLGEVVPELVQKQQEYQAQYGSSWVTEGLVGIGEHVGDRYSDAAVDSGDIVGALVGQGLKFVAGAIGEAMISPEQRQLAAQLHFLQQRVDQAESQHSRFAWLHGLVMLGTIGWWASFREPPRVPVSAPVAAEDVQASPKASTFSLEGTWRDDITHDLYEATRQGDRVVFTRQTTTGSKDPYAVGDVVFSLRTPSADDHFEEELMMRPALPAGVRLDTTARAACVQSWKDFQGSPLQASVSGQRLNVTFLNASVPAAGLLIKGGKVIGCKPIEASKVQRSEKTLAR